MNEGISKKTLILSVVKLLLGALGFLLTWVLPFEGITTGKLVISVLADMFSPSGSVGWVMSLFAGLFYLLFIAFAITMLVKNSLLLAAVIKQKNGKATYTSKEWHKKINLGGFLAPAILWFVGSAIYSLWRHYPPYVILIFGIADVIIFAIFKKSLKLKKKNTVSVDENS